MRIFPMIVYTRATVNSTPHTTLSTITSLRRVRLFNRRPNGTVLMIRGGGCGSFVRRIDVTAP